MAMLHCELDEILFRSQILFLQDKEKSRRLYVGIHASLLTMIWLSLLIYFKRAGKESTAFVLLNGHYLVVIRYCQSA